MLFEVAGKETKDRMGMAVGVHGGGEAPVEAFDGHSDGASGLLGGVGYSGTIRLLVIVERLEVAHCLQLHGLDLVLVFKKGFQLRLGAKDGAHGCGVIQGGAALLDSGVAFGLGHPEALRLRYFVYEGSKKWELAAEVAQALCKMAPGRPFGWMHLACALHEMKRTKEARNVLLPVVGRFPEEHMMRYRLACYSCRLGYLKAAWKWLEKAIDLAGKKDIRMMALNDPDLERLWTDIAEI